MSKQASSKQASSKQASSKQASSKPASRKPARRGSARRGSVAPATPGLRVACFGGGAAPLLNRLPGHALTIERCEALDDLLYVLHERAPDVVLVHDAPPDGSVESVVPRVVAIVDGAVSGLPVVVVCRPGDRTPPHRHVAAGAHAAVDADASPADVAAVLASVAARFEALRTARADAATRGSWIRTKGEQIHAFREALLELDHEIMTPVAVVQGYCANLADGLAGPVTDAQRAQLERMRAAANLIAGVMDRFKSALPDEKDVREALGHDARARRRERLRVPDLVEEAVSMFEATAREKAVTLTAEIEPRCQPVWGDRVRLLQLLVNLLANAVRHAPRGGRVAVTVTFRDVPGERSACRVAVIDDGPGIAREDQWKIFFSGWSTDPERRGMGLAVCAEVAAEHGASISLESEAGEGATFTVDLPLDPRARRSATTDAARREQT